MSGERDDPQSQGAPIEASRYQARLAEQAAGEHGEPETAAKLIDFRARWDALSSRQKLRAQQFGVAAAISVLGYGLYSASGADTPVATAPTTSKLDMGAGLRGDSLELKLRGDLKKVLDGQNLLGDRITAIEEGKTPIIPHAAPGADADGGPLPPALPGSPPDLPVPPSPSEIGSAEGSLPVPPVPPSGPPAPPAPPVEKVVGAIGQATTPIVPKDGAGGAGSDSKKRVGRFICRLVLCGHAS